MEVPFKFNISEVPNAVKKYQTWIIINLLGLIVYAFFSYWNWPFVDPQYGLIDPLDWFAGGLPFALVLLVMFLINVICLILILWRKSRPAIFVWLIVILVWPLMLYFIASIRPQGAIIDIKSPDQKIYFQSGGRMKTANEIRNERMQKSGK